MKIPVLESLFNQVVGLKVADLQAFIEERLQYRPFPVNIAKFLRTTFL